MTYSLLGYRWTEPSSITWSFGEVAVSPSWTILPFKGAITDEGMRGVVRAAFELWETVAGVDFVEVPLATGAGEPDVQIGFGKSSSPDQVGVAYTRYREGEILHSLILLTSPGHFDWSLERDGSDYAYNKPGQPAGAASSLLWTTVHELGHVLGIAHSSDYYATMAPVIGRHNERFSAEDIAAVQSLYGAPPGWKGEPPGFDAAAYLRANPDVAAAGMDAQSHHSAFGAREGRDGAVWFDDGFYLARNPDVAAAGIDPLVHYMAFGHAEDRAIQAAAGPKVAPEGFDRQHYLMTNDDVATSGMDPRAHYAGFGWREGRDPNAWFDVRGYLEHNPDVAAAGVDPLAHFHASGWREGRDPSEAFDTAAYLAANADVAAAGIDPLVHLMQFGLAEGRAAVTDFVWG